MKYFLLLAGHDRDTGPFEELTPEQQEAEMAKHGAFGEACELSLIHISEPTRPY